MEDMVTVATTWPTGDKVGEIRSEVSVPTLELVRLGFMHRLFCPVLTHCPGAKQSEVLPANQGSRVS